MASGDQVIMPDEGYSLSEVTVTKPATLIPENIKKDVDIGGIVGTMEGGASGKRSVTFSNADGGNTARVFYIEDGIFKKVSIGGSLASTGTVEVDYGTTIYVSTDAMFSTFIPTVEGATATNYIEDASGKFCYAHLMYILEQ